MRKKELQKQFGIKKLIKKERNKLYIKWKGYGNSFK